MGHTIARLPLIHCFLWTHPHSRTAVIPLARGTQGEHYLDVKVLVIHSFYYSTWRPPNR